MPGRWSTFKHSHKVTRSSHRLKGCDYSAAMYHTCTPRTLYTHCAVVEVRAPVLRNVQRNCLVHTLVGVREPEGLQSRAAGGLQSTCANVHAVLSHGVDCKRQSWECAAERSCMQDLLRLHRIFFGRCGRHILNSKSCCWAVLLHTHAWVLRKGKAFRAAGDLQARTCAQSGGVATQSDACVTIHLTASGDSCWLRAISEAGLRAHYPFQRRRETTQSGDML